MSPGRTPESNARHHFRSERISSVNGQYYFTSREGTLEGPFGSRRDAEQEIALYIRRMLMRGDIVDSRAQ